MLKNEKVSIVVPVYNEAENLKILIPEIFKYLKTASVIIVDDNSKDDTKQILLSFRKKYKSLHHLTRKSKLGRGTAVIYGFLYGSKNTDSEVFVEMDADLSHDPKELPKLVNLVNDTTVGVASRYMRRSKIVNSPVGRKILSRAANAFNSFLFGLPIHDNTNGYRAYPRRAIDLLLKYKFKSTGFVTISESTYYLHKSGFKVREYPTIFVNRRLGGSKADFHEVFISLRDLIKIRFGI